MTIRQGSADTEQKLEALSQRATMSATGSAIPQLTVGDLTADFGHQCIDRATFDALLTLASDRSLGAERDRMLAGERINSTEARAVLHSALRFGGGAFLRQEQQPPESVQKAVTESLQQLESFVRAVHQGERRGYTGKRFTDVVNIGIGGSHLGPELIVDALKPATGAPLRAHFLSNIDGHTVRQVLRALNPETTLFVVASKSFGTLETALNAIETRSWFLERTASLEALGSHFVAVSNNVEAASGFGINPANLFPMGEWVGGRYSLWSSVGLVIALSLGWDTFLQLLAGGRQLDEHFASAALAENLPMVLALTEFWNVNLLGATSHSVLCYDDRLRLLPDYLQQLEMESNGKRISREGIAVDRTQPILWGGVGTNGQHAFHQLLHQGTERYFADFILCRHADHQRPAMHRELLANALAQAQAMAFGRKHEDPHRVVPGGHPSTLLILDRLTPRALGTLLAAYEHKVFCLGILWNINSFDQWGVELGKALAKPLSERLANPTNDGDRSATPLPVATERQLATLKIEH